MRKACLWFLFGVLFGYAKPTWSQGKIASRGEMPTLAWNGIPPEETTLERYQELRGAGMNYAYASFHNLDELTKALDIASRVDIKLIVFSPELKKDTKKTVELLMHYPALAGYYLADEPKQKDFAELATWAGDIHAVDTQHFSFVNMHPNYASPTQLGSSTYDEYVKNFVNEVPVGFLSFDHYPVMDIGLQPDWYDNLETISDVARKAGKSFWAFALTVPIPHHPVPTLAHLRLQVFSDLAYGAQGIEYFTYWTPRSEGFKDGPISLEGRRTAIYDRLRAVNVEIKALSGVFLGSKVIWVAHTGNTIPLGTKPVGSLPSPVKSLSTKGTGAVVSLLQNGNNTFLVVVNRDYKQPMELTVQFGDSNVKRILKDGSMVPASVYMDELEVDPGDVMVWTWTSK